MDAVQEAIKELQSAASREQGMERWLLAGQIVELTLVVVVLWVVLHTLLQRPRVS